MRLHNVYQGKDRPFEGDLTLMLRGLPAGARVTNATVTVSPAASFLDETIFVQGAGSFGCERLAENEIHFHARRMLSRVTAQGTAAQLFVDFGAGIYTQVTATGALRTPDTSPEELKLTGTGEAYVLPALTATRFKLYDTASPPAPLAISAAAVRLTPTNVSVRLGQLPPFWTHVGELADEQTSDDFAAVAMAVLATATPADGCCALPFTIHSDSIARLDVAVELEYVLVHDVLPPGLAEVVAMYGYSTLPSIDPALTIVRLPAGAVPVAAAAQLAGEFATSRIAAGPLGREHDSCPIACSPNCSLAQYFTTQEEIVATGIDLAMGNTAPSAAGMVLTVRDDADGRPFGDPLIRAAVKVERPLPGQSTWGSVTLPRPFRFLRGRRYWLLLQSQKEIAFWNATPTPAPEWAGGVPLQHTRDNGLSWRQVTLAEATIDAPARCQAAALSLPGGGLTALFRLRTTPDKYTTPLWFKVGDSAARRLGEYDALGRVQSTANLGADIAAHLQQVGCPECLQADNQLTNGDFVQPPFDDATELLLGNAPLEATAIGGRASLQGVPSLPQNQNLDLSSRRFLNITVNDRQMLRIDCAGDNPAQTTARQIVDRINGALNTTLRTNDLLASVDSQGRLQIMSPKPGSGQQASLRLAGWRPGNSIEGWTAEAKHTGQVSRQCVRFASELGTDMAYAARLEGTEHAPAAVWQRVHARPGCTYALQYACRVLAAQTVEFRTLREQPGATPGTPALLSNPFSESGIRFSVRGNDLSFAQFLTQGSFAATGGTLFGLAAGKELTLVLEQPVYSLQISLSTKEGAASIELVGEKGRRLERRTASGENVFMQFDGPAIQRAVIRSDPPEANTVVLLHSVTMSAPHASPTCVLRWLDAETNVLPGTEQELPSMADETTDQMQLRRGRFKAPAGAAQAEIRLVQPGAGVALFSNVAWHGSDELLVNGDFAQRFARVPKDTADLAPGWTVVAGEARLDGANLTLRGDQLHDTVVAQTVTLPADTLLDLRIHVEGQAAPQPRQLRQQDARRQAQHSRCEVQWLDAGQQPLAPAQVVVLDEPGFPLFAWRGEAPNAAAAAEIRLIQPHGSNATLSISRCALRGIEMLDVPLTFLSEAPGQLAISSFTVSYNLPEVSLTSLPLMVKVQPVLPQGVRFGLLNRPASELNGISTNTANVLRNSAAINTIGDLAALEPSGPLAGISYEQQLAYKAQAELVAALPVQPEWQRLGNQPLPLLLPLPPDSLTALSGTNLAAAAGLSRTLRTLALLLKPSAFQGLRASDLLTSA